MERYAAGNPLQSFAFFQIGERPEKLLHMLGEPEVEPPLHHLERLAAQLLVGKNRHPRFEHMGARHDLADRLAKPADDSIIGDDERFVNGLAHPSGAPFDLARQGLLSGGVEGFGGLAHRRRIGGKSKSVELPDVLARDQYVTAWGDLGFQHGVLP